ncbi:diguanylate cyclase [Oceanithermus profundus DSM 14977]|uniref:Diguanylate cyclase n=1 Tax=Oceanithermus profundus (strain DSM 14977 / NBRC 100410 / VKM B-2274 / 506) TaxID=670487 RepID=E4U934_OCEP5|nr:GGDEF domain-containing protein [Oceanithermus profundus]ADR36864.1 diguanylate cyclase [Oceanithermus profundus DSM 14977]
MPERDPIDRLKRGVYFGLALAGTFSLVIGYVVLTHPTRENDLLLVYAALLVAVAFGVALGAPTRWIERFALAITALFFLAMTWLNLHSIGHGAGVWPPLLWGGIVYLLAYVLFPPKQAYAFAWRYYVVLLLGGLVALQLGRAHGPLRGEQINDTLQILLSNLGYLWVSRVLVAFGLRAEADRAQAKQMQKLVDTDALTGCLSRRRFLEETEALLESGRPGSLILFDLDNFKQINDTYGHPTGDRVLMRSVKRTLHNLREEDRLGRLGGEEFAVLLPGVGLEEALRLAERLRRALEAPSDEGPPATASFGVVETGRLRTTSELLARADRALYRAKHAGKNRVAAARG